MASILQRLPAGVPYAYTAYGSSSSAGYASGSPAAHQNAYGLTDNATAEGQARNRRVELRKK